MTVQAAGISTPDGVFTVVADEKAVLASGWTDDTAALLALIHPALRPPSSGVAIVRPDGATDTMAGAALAAVAAYYDGDLAAPAAVPVRQRSGEFRELAWEVLRGIGPGRPVTYTEYAARAGRPAAVRAAAGACAMNAAALFVPCHRVLRTDGTLGGFRYGMDLKQRLLAREAAAAEPAVVPLAVTEAAAGRSAG